LIASEKHFKQRLPIVVSNDDAAATSRGVARDDFSSASHRFFCRSCEIDKFGLLRGPGRSLARA
jgi:hypothetical protein